MRTTSDQTRRQAALAYYTGRPASEAARRKVFEDTGIDLGPEVSDPVAGGKALLGFLIVAAIALLAAPFYVAARGLWMAEPALMPHDVNTGLLTGFAVFALAVLGLFLTTARRIHPMAAFVGVGTVLMLGLLTQANGWAMTAFLLAELALLAAWVTRRREAAKGGEKLWRAIRDWAVLIVCALMLMAMSVEPDGASFAEGLADMGVQLLTLFTVGYMDRAGEIGGALGLPALAVGVGLPLALALLYMPLNWVLLKLIR